MLAVVLAGAAWGQAPNPEAVGVVVVLQNGAATGLDISFPAGTTAASVNQEAASLARWTGWALGAPETHVAPGVTSAHLAVTGSGGPVTPEQAVWAIVGALAHYGRLGVVFMGVEAAPATSTFENRYVRLEQSGGQGVQSYQVFIKNAGFRNLAELQRVERPQQMARRPGTSVLAWLLLVIASVAVGVAAYLISKGLTLRASQTSHKGRH